jgi:hypothetical protein
VSRHHHEELIQGEIDGVNSAADSARLEGLLVADPGVRARYESLLRVSGALDRAERLDPPPGFADDVMSVVRRRVPGAEAQPGWREAFRALFSPVPLAACACTLIVGLVVGALLPTDPGLLSLSERDALTGTALPGSRIVAPGTLGQRSFVRDGVRGEAVARLENDLLVVDLELVSTSPVAVGLEFEGTGLAPRAFSRDVPSGAEVVMGEGQVRFSHPVGRNLYTISFGVGDASPRALRLRVGEGEGWELPVRAARTP